MMVKKSEKIRLSPKQMKAISCLVNAPSITEGCRKTGIHIDTYYEWLKDPVFKNELKERREESCEEAFDLAKSHLSLAVQRLIALIKQDESKGIMRLACNDLFNIVFKAKDAEMERRLGNLEKQVFHVIDPELPK